MEEKISNLIPEKYDTFDQFCEEAYAVEVAELLTELSFENMKKILIKFDAEQLGEIISHLDYESSNFIAKILTIDQLSDILTNMYPDDAADFLGTMPVGTVKKILSNLKENQAKELQRLLEYDEESAGGIMTTDYIAFYSDHTTDTVLKKLRQLVDEPEMIYYLYVISRNKELVGVLSVRQLLAAPTDEILANIMTENVIKAFVDQDQEEVARMLSKYDLLAIPIVNKKDQLMGIITVDDAIDVMEEEATEDMYKMAVTSDISEREGVFSAVKKRIPWLFILLFGDLLSGSVIHSFEAQLQSAMALAIFIPVLMDMGGNMGTQSLTVVVRGLATGELDLSSFGKHLWQEIKAGVIMAFLLGLTLSVAALVWQGNPVLGIVVGTSLFSTLLTAVIAGTSIPFIINYLGADPAVAAGPFITTLIDISGLFIYFTMATILMENLL
ncbi:MAG: magnesium transporter [Halanaerobiales bacterium]